MTTRLPSLLLKVYHRLSRRRREEGDNRWEDVERFEEGWKDRIRLMAGYVPPGASVLDLGCGPMWLREYIVGSPYIGVDYRDRGPGTIVCDFNRQQFPDQNADVAFISGCLEYVEDLTWFLSKIRLHCPTAVVSYCTVDRFPDERQRNSLGWRNHLSDIELRQMWKEAGFDLEADAVTPTSNSLYVFKRIPNRPR